MKPILQSSALAVSLVCLVMEAHAASTSAYQSAPLDPRAITVKAKGDGQADDTAAIQAALNAAVDRELGGLVFLPSGRYRITRTLLIPGGVRLYGVGATRPLLLLADSTAGFQKGVATMVVFTGGDQYGTGKVPVPVATAVPYSEKVRDATSSTFYSALSNVNFDMGKGNPAAVGVRMRTAQHSNLSHIDFHIKSGLAGMYHAGNVSYKLNFFGGRYGILAEKTSPAWQFTLMDANFDGQRDAAIREHETRLVLVNTSIKNTPVGIEIDRGYSDALWGKDVRFENVSKAALIISNENSVFTQIGFDNATARNTPVFARYRESGKTVRPDGAAYRVSEFNYGLMLPDTNSVGQFGSNVKSAPLPALPAAPAPVLRNLPASGEWVNVHTLGVKGDGMADDTAALQQAIDTHRVLYLPLGIYVVNDTLKLRADSVIIGLHPGQTQIALQNGLPAFAGIGKPKALMESAKGGNALITGFSLATGEVNPRAMALLWKAGEQSLVDDIRIQPNWGQIAYDGRRKDPFVKPANFDPEKYWDRQYPSIWVTDGGGGTFTGIWTHNAFAHAGLLVSHTKTPGKVYQMSAEHHVRNEIILDKVENWEFLAPQTEQEQRDGIDTVSTDIRNSKNILFANYHGYRVTRSLAPELAAVRVSNSSDIRFRNFHVNAESGYASCDADGCGTYLRASKYPFENSIVDVTNKAEVREHEFAVLNFTGKPSRASFSKHKVIKLEDGFFSLAGGVVDAKGKLYFVDRKFHRIYRYAKGEGLSIVRDAPLDPINLAIDASGALLVQSMFGKDTTVYSFHPDAPLGDMTVLTPTPVTPRPNARTAMPVNFWNNAEFRDQIDHDTYEFTTLGELFARDVAVAKTHEYVSPDGSLVMPALRVWRQGPPDHIGWRWSDTVQTHGLISGKVGERLVFTNSSENLTYSGLLGAGGKLTELKKVAGRGGESAAVDAKGNVYVANGQVFVYGANGKEIDRIDVPERPLQLLFGGADRTTLFILTHRSLYAVER